MDPREHRLNPPDRPLWRRLAQRFERALSDWLAASEPKRKRPRNLYIKGMTARGLVTRPYSE
jgi:hypothetical protein